MALSTPRESSGRIRDASGSSAPCSRAKRAATIHSVMKTKLPSIDYKGEDARAIALLAGRLCLLPDKKTVGQFKKAVFPTQRKTALRATPIIDESNKEIGMWDDNTTPRWALRWSHGVQGGNRALKGWHVAHVWNNCNNVQCYTRLENLLLVPAAYAGLTDDDGPLTPYLRYHAFKAYGWWPKGQPPPKKPSEYQKFTSEWRYLCAASGSARERVLTRLRKSQSERAKVLQDFIKNISYWPQPQVGHSLRPRFP